MGMLKQTRSEGAITTERFWGFEIVRAFEDR